VSVVIIVSPFGIGGTFVFLLYFIVLVLADCMTMIFLSVCGGGVWGYVKLLWLLLRIDIISSLCSLWLSYTCLLGLVL